MSIERAVHTAYYRGFQIQMTSTDTGWTMWIAGQPRLFDLIFLDFSPAYSLIDMLVVMGKI